MAVRQTFWITTIVWVVFSVLSSAPVFAAGQDSGELVIGLDADMSGAAASGGESIRRGALLAIDEINTSGGVLGRKLVLEVRDHRAIPARGVDNMTDFAEMKNLVAVLGGIHTPVALAELDVIHQNQIVYLGPWAAGTPVVDNGRNPNFVFRVSVRDQHAGRFLIDAARKRGFSKIGLLLWRTGWGRSNEVAMTSAIREMGLTLAGTEWFNTTQRNITPEIERLTQKGAEVIMLVAAPVEGQTVVRNMAALDPASRRPIISHWGITGGRFYDKVAREIQSIDLSFLQTHSFYAPVFPERARKVVDAYCKRFKPCSSVDDIISPVGTAHAYDLVHLLAIAIRQANSTDRTKIRQALEQIDRYDGLLRDYRRPFTAAVHDALDARDFMLARFGSKGTIRPLPQE